jgi:myo-inositol-1(or 4)-monophosphatase
VTTRTDDRTARDLLGLATDIAHDAGQLLADYAGRTDLDVATKTSETDPVSAADRASEQLISERLRSHRPDDGLVGEEQAGDRHGTTGLRWVVDPLDGTVNFLYGIPQWCVSIAVEDDAGVVAGVVHDPSRGETFAAARGGGATLNGAALGMTPPARVADALIATGYSYEPAVRSDQVQLLAALIEHVRDVRRFGSAALDLAWLAAGRWDGYAEFTLHRWDWSAGSLIVREAGGQVSRWVMTLGGAARDGLAAGSAPVHDHLSAWLAGNGGRTVPLTS